MHIKPAAKVNWKTACRPKALGGLGVLNLDTFARALRLRSPWLEWKAPEKLWVDLGTHASRKIWTFSMRQLWFLLETVPPWISGILLGSGDVALWTLPRISSACARAKSGPSLWLWWRLTRFGSDSSTSLMVYRWTISPSSLPFGRSCRTLS